MKISFDFDGTLTASSKVISLAKKFIALGADVWIVTRRSAKWDSSSLKDVLFELNLPISKVIFTELEYKSMYVTDFDLHIDDDQIDIDLINTPVSNCLALKYTN